MRKTLSALLILCFFCCESTQAQYVDLYPGGFQTFLRNTYPSCFSSAGFDTTCSLITSEDTLIFQGLNCENLDGIQYFDGLVYLDISENTIQDISYPGNLPPSLRFLKASDIGIFMLQVPILPPALERLEWTRTFCSSFTNLPPSLRYIDISDSRFFTIPALPPALDTFICKKQGGADGTLTSITSLPNTLRYIDCSWNSLQTLPNLPNSLKYLDCSYQFRKINPQYQDKVLGSLPSVPSSLEYLNCSGNKLTSLPALPSALRYLDCSKQRWYRYQLDGGFFDQTVVAYQGLQTLPPLPANLEDLICNYNIIPTLNNLPASLRVLYCGSNQLSALPNFPASLQILSCGYNNISSLPSLPAGLVELSCSSCGLLELPSPLPFNLGKLTCGTNNITCLPHLPASLTTLDITGTLINCLPNSGTYTSTPPRPLCTPINNSHHCPSAPVIAGTLFYDNNSNGTREPNENVRPNIEVSTNAGLYAYSNLNGYFEVSGDSGLNVLNLTAPPYYAVIPSTNNFLFSSYDTLASQLYPLQPQVSIDSVTVNLVALLSTRPGASVEYQLGYSNVGTTVVPATITVDYNPAHLNFTSASIPGVTTNGSRLTLPVINLTPGDAGNLLIRFSVLINAQLGDTTYVKANAVAGSSVMRDSVYSIIRGSFDPNDKHATPKLSPEQLVSGDFINYVIRFQNTGNDTAINVVVTDILNAQLDFNSFQLINTSHPAIVKRSGNNLSFEFLNIMLPDSNVNELASHGFIRFRIRPIPSLTVGSIIPNMVNIYFDYNNSVATNTTTTRIEATVVPLSLLSFDVMQVNDKKAYLRWSTARESGTRLFEIERSKDGTSFENIGYVNAVGSGDNVYSFDATLNAELVYFRLKMIDLDGRYAYSDVKKLRVIKDGQKISLASNPVRNTLLINCSHTGIIGTKATIIDNSGKKVSEFLIAGGAQHIDISAFHAGIYYLRTCDGVLKFVVTK